ncbi:hypothetical protein [Halorussus caseinilyticus]|uniref:Uncharacterized protein n=1 Tax=Halorussus caseinilyticus TaxID=3034025 RepID=A0ABD5WK94_9EURY|nr:hypothetical protein [Halorussus sp. DT72]
MNYARHERYAYALALFALGVAFLGHGMAATVYTDGVTPVTVALPLVGSVVAYRSFVGLLPPGSSLSADGFLALLAAVTTAVVNLVVPAIDATTDLFAAVSSPPAYWPAVVAGVAGFTTLGVYELLADRLSGPHALAKLLGAGTVATAVGVLLLVAPARPSGFLTPGEAMAGVGGAVLAAVLFDGADAPTQ